MFLNKVISNFPYLPAFHLANKHIFHWKCNPLVVQNMWKSAKVCLLTGADLKAKAMLRIKQTGSQNDLAPERSQQKEQC